MYCTILGGKYFNTVVKKNSCLITCIQNGQETDQSLFSALVLTGPFMPFSCDDLSLNFPASFLVLGSSDQSLQRQRVHIGGLVKGSSGGLHSGGDPHLVWLRHFAT